MAGSSHSAIGRDLSERAYTNKINVRAPRISRSRVRARATCPPPGRSWPPPWRGAIPLAHPSQTPAAPIPETSFSLRPPLGVLYPVLLCPPVCLAFRPLRLFLKPPLYRLFFHTENPSLFPSPRMDNQGSTRLAGVLPPPTVEAEPSPVPSTHPSCFWGWPSSTAPRCSACDSRGLRVSPVPAMPPLLRKEGRTDGRTDASKLTNSSRTQT